MNPLVTKKYIFTRILAGKPIVLDMMEHEDRLRYTDTLKLFFETGVFEYIDPGSNENGNDTIVRHTIHFIVPRNDMPHVMEVNAGTRWTRLGQQFVKQREMV